MITYVFYWWEYEKKVTRLVEVLGKLPPLLGVRAHYPFKIHVALFKSILGFGRGGANLFFLYNYSFLLF